MRSEKLDRRIVLQRATVSRDGFNNQIETWADLATVWASWRPSTAREQLASQETGAGVDDVIEIRWSSVWADLNAKDRLIYNGRTYNIVEANEIPRRKGIRIKATARAD